MNQNRSLDSFSIIFSQSQDTSMSKIFAMDLEELMNTKVSIATKSDQLMSESPSVVSVITSEEIKNMGAREIADILQMIPGFDISTRYTGEYGIGVRGVKDSKTTSKILIMVDGVPTNQLFYGNSIQMGYEINTDIIERIEIIRGPGSALYGRNAFSAVINIITKNGKTNKSGFVKGTVGNFNTKSGSFYYGVQKEKLHSLFAIKRLITDVTDTKFDNGFGGISRWNLFHNNLNINSTIGYGKFTFSGMYSNLKSGSMFANTTNAYELGNYSLTFNNTINPKCSIKARLYGYNASYYEDIEQVKPGINDNFPLGVYFKPQLNEYMYGFETELKYKVGSKNDLLFGIQSDIHGVKDVLLQSNLNLNIDTTPPLPGIGRNGMPFYSFFVNDGHNYYNAAFFMQDVWYPIKNLGITIGGRYDLDSQIGGVFNPRAGIVFTPAKNAIIKFLYGRAYRAPAPSEQYQIFGYAVGNKNLKPEIINTIELVLSYRIKYMTNSISLFRNSLTNMIHASNINSVDLTNNYYNIGENTSLGIEYENKLIIGRYLYTYLNYSYTFSENRDSINGIESNYTHADVAPHKLNIGSNLKFMKYFNWNINMFYRSKMEKFLVSGTKVQDEIGNYTVINSTIRFENLIKGLSLSCSLYNLLDTKYYSQDNEHLNQPPQPGRQVAFSVNYTF